MSNLLTLALILFAAVFLYGIRDRLLAALRRFDARNTRRRADEARALMDRYAHYRQTVEFAEEQFEPVATLTVPDARTGERACAVIAVKDGADPLTFQEMADFLRDHQLRVQAIPEQLELIDAVPRNPSGKILKHKLRERYSA